MNSITFSGTHIGLVISQFLSGFLSESEFLGGWPSVFYVMGTCGLISAILWFVFVCDSPADHSTISAKEREYIEKNTTQAPKRKSAPWRRMLTSRPAWAYHICGIGVGFSQYGVGSFLPIYIEQVLHFNIGENGLLSALPHILSFVCNVIGGILSDFLLMRTDMKTGAVRKIMIALGGFGLVGFSVAAAYTGCDVTANIIFLTLSIGLTGILYSGLYVNPLDIACTYAGTMFGISNTLGNIPGFIAPYITASILGEEPTLARWRTVFLFTGGVCTFSTLFFVVFASGEVQSWATDDKNPSDGDLRNGIQHPANRSEIEIEVTVKQLSERTVNESYIPDELNGYQLDLAE